VVTPGIFFIKAARLPDNRAELPTMIILDRIKRGLFGPISKFKVGQSVQLLEGDCLMVVFEIAFEEQMKEPLIHCQWFDRESKSIRRNLFSEKDLKPFDWDWKH
jgi:uncharacterized protein YodC (DUF2158 family)